MKKTIAIGLLLSLMVLFLGGILVPDAAFAGGYRHVYDDYHHKHAGYWGTVAGYGIAALGIVGIINAFAD